MDARGNRKRRDFHIPTAPTSLPLPNPKDQTQHTRTPRALVFRGAESDFEKMHACMGGVMAKKDRATGQPVLVERPLEETVVVAITISYHHR